MQISNEKTEKKERVYFDRESATTKTEVFEEITKEYGFHVKMFNSKESAMFWKYVVKKIPNNISLPSDVLMPTNLKDPFLCGLVAEKIIVGTSYSTSEMLILDQYIKERCRDKGVKGGVKMYRHSGVKVYHL